MRNGNLTKRSCAYVVFVQYCMYLHAVVAKFFLFYRKDKHVEDNAIYYDALNAKRVLFSTC